MNDDISSYLQIHLSGNESLPAVRRAENAITEVSDAICKIQSSIKDLKRIRDQCRIHIQQYEADYNMMISMYESMKEQLSGSSDAPPTPDKMIPNAAPNLSQQTREQSYLSGQSKEANAINRQQNIQIQQNRQTDGQNILNNNINSQNNQHAQNNAPIDHSTHSEPSQMSIVDIPWQISPSNNLFNVRLRFALSTPAVLCSVQFDPTGRCIAFSDGRLLHVISSENGALMYSVEIPGSINRNELHTRVIRFSPDGRLIAVSSMSSSVSIISTETRKCIGSLEFHKKTVSSLLFLKDNRLISGSYDGVLCIWDLQRLSLIKMIQHGAESNGKLNKEGAIVSLATDSDESYILVGFMKGCVGIYEPTFTQPMNTFSAHNEYLLCVETVPNESSIVTTSQDKSAKLWTLHGVASCKHVFNGHRDYVICASMAKNSNLMITGSKDETLKWWNRDTGEELFTIIGHKNTLFEVHHHPTENAIVSCSGDGLVCMWEYTPPQ